MIKNIIRIAVLISCLNSFVFGQTPANFEINNKILKDACTGGSSGKGTFKTDLNSLEYILTSKMNKKSLDKTLPHFVDDPLRVTFSYNDETKDHDLPNYEISYVILKKGKIDKTFIAVISMNINNPIQSIMLLGVSSLEADQVIQAAKNNGYLTRETRNSILNKYYSDKKRKLYLEVAARSDGQGFNITISKL